MSVPNTGPAPSGEHERRLAAGTLWQQASTVLGVLSMLSAVTVLARTLSLEEFGTYGLLVSFSTYLLVVQGSVEATAVREIARAADAAGRDRAFSTAMSLYGMIGVGAAILILGLGVPALSLFDIEPDLRSDARAGVAAVALGTLIGWPMKTFHDVLRGRQSFALAALAEGVAYLLVGGSLVALALADAPLWLLAGVGGALPFAIGALSAVIVTTSGLGARLRPSLVRLQTLMAYTRYSSYLLAASLTDVIIYSLDRAVLGAFRSAATVGLYEGPIRAHNLVRQMNATLTGTVLPAASRYIEEGDTERQRALILRGSRYSLAAVTPVTIVLMVLAEPILTVWLGDRYAVAATALAILVSYWLVGASASVPASLLLAAGQVRWLAGYAWVHAVLSLSLSLALTAWLGLNGLVLGTSVAYLSVSPLIFRKLFAVFPVTPREFAREVWFPAYASGIAIAVALVAARATLSLDSLPGVLALAGGGMLGYWALFYAVWLRPSERNLVRTFFPFGLGRA